MEVTTANSGGQLMPPSTTMASPQQDSNNKQQYKLVNNKITNNNTANNMTNNSFADEASNLNNNNNRTTSSSDNCMSSLNSKHVNSASSVVESETENVYPELTREGKSNISKVCIQTKESEFEVIKDIMRQVLDKIETESTFERQKQSSNNELEIPMEIISTQSENALPVTVTAEEKKLAFDEMSAKEKEQLESSPEDGTCDLIIDPEALQPPTSNESQLEASNLDQSPTQCETPKKEEENRSSLVSHNTMNLEESQDFSLEKKTADISRTCINTNPFAKISEEKFEPKESASLSTSITKESPKSVTTTDAQDESLQLPQDIRLNTTNEKNVITGSSLIVTGGKETVGELIGVVSQNKIINDQEELEEKAKDMVTLRNLEISPPPPSTSEDTPSIVDTARSTESIQNKASESTGSTGGKKKRASTESVGSTGQSEPNEGGGRAKRQRTQTKLFQAGEGKALDESFNSRSSRNNSFRSSTRGRKKSTTSSTTSDTNVSNNQDSSTIQQHLSDVQDVIFYEKNDYLAIRNEEDTFYLCQLTENVRIMRPFVRVKWLDTKDEGKTYFLTSHYDKVPQKSIIMPVNLIKSVGLKKTEQIFSLAENEKDIILARLKRSLTAVTESASQQSN